MVSAVNQAGFKKGSLATTLSLRINPSDRWGVCVSMEKMYATNYFLRGTGKRVEGGDC